MTNSNTEILEAYGVRVTFYLLACGVLFGLGEMFALEWSFFTSSSVTDFFAKAAKAVIPLSPVILISAFYFHPKRNSSEIGQKFETTLEKTVIVFSTKLVPQVIAALFVICGGYFSIAIQCKKTIDATVYLHSAEAENSAEGNISGNLLATNSSSIAIYSGEKLYLIPMSNVEKIEYIKSNYARKRCMMWCP